MDFERKIIPKNGIFVGLLAQSVQSRERKWHQVITNAVFTGAISGQLLLYLSDHDGNPALQITLNVEHEAVS